MQKINEEIIEALEKASEHCGNLFRLSKKIGVERSTVYFWMTGKTKSIEGDTWNKKVLPMIQPYLKHKISEPAEPYTAEAVTPGDLFEIPVISFAHAASYDPTLEPIDAFAKDCSDEKALFSCRSKDGYFALRVEGDSMSPVLPDGSIIYVAGGEFAERGDLVVAKLRDSGDVVVKKYQRHNNVISLESINPNGKSYQWNIKESPGYLVWMWPVIEYTVRARQQRWEKIKQNI